MQQTQPPHDTGSDTRARAARFLVMLARYPDKDSVPPNRPLARLFAGAIRRVVRLMGAKRCGRAA